MALNMKMGADTVGFIEHGHDLAAPGFNYFGEERHPAALNFDDGMPYALLIRTSKNFFPTDPPCV